VARNVKELDILRLGKYSENYGAFFVITDDVSRKGNAITVVRLSVLLFPLRILNQLTFELAFCA